MVSKSESNTMLFTSIAFFMTFIQISLLIISSIYSQENEFDSEIFSDFSNNQTNLIFNVKTSERFIEPAIG